MLLFDHGRAGAAARKIPLYRHIANLAGHGLAPLMPVPAFNIINGGSHAGNALAMQEFMILVSAKVSFVPLAHVAVSFQPIGAPSFAEALRMGAEVYQVLKGIIKEKYGQDSINVGDEGGFAPNILANDEGLQLVVSAINKAGFEGKVKIGMDVAASEFWNEQAKKYDLNFKAKGVFVVLLVCFLPRADLW